MNDHSKRCGSQISTVLGYYEQQFCHYFGFSCLNIAKIVTGLLSVLLGGGGGFAQSLYSIRICWHCSSVTSDRSPLNEKHDNFPVKISGKDISFKC